MLGLEILKEILPANAFDGAGEKGPAYFLTDDSITQ